MRRALPASLVALVLLLRPAPAAGDPPSPLTDAVARAAGSHTLDTGQAFGQRVLTAPRRRMRHRPSARRAVITGFVVGALVGGTVAYREYGAEGIWYGVYTVGIPCAVAGWVVSQ